MERNNIMKLQSLIHNHLSSSEFMSMIEYTWFKAEYLDTHSNRLKTVTEVYFESDDLKFNIYNINSYLFIRCSYYSQILYNDHFFDNYYFH